ncbi:hypothetical protein K7432_010561 [Basidiobolus ranarum]|uniref:Up-regulated during septation protein 1 domain-containing protein n=1 Tax=Basidiobolus ranarum TaxID=34480 RepID=A0ABR2WNP7_9FUNG
MSALFQSRRRGLLPRSKERGNAGESNDRSYLTPKNPNYTTTAEYAPIHESSADSLESWDVREKPLPILPPLLRPHISTVAEFTSHSEHYIIPPNPVVTIPSIAASEDHQMKVLISQALQDACEYKVLTIKQMEQLRQDYEAQRNQMSSLNSLLSYETKFLDNAHTLIQLHASNKYLLKKTSEELANAGRKVDEVANSLWKVTQRANQTLNRMLHHTAGVLAVALFKVSSDQENKLAKSNFAQSFVPSTNGKLQHINKVDPDSESNDGHPTPTITSHDEQENHVVPSGIHPILHMSRQQILTEDYFHPNDLTSITVAKKDWTNIKGIDEEPIKHGLENHSESSLISSVTTNSLTDIHSESSVPSVESEYIETVWNPVKAPTQTVLDLNLLHQPQPIYHSNNQNYPSLMTKLTALQDEVEIYRSRVESLEFQLQETSPSDEGFNPPSFPEHDGEMKHLVHSVLQPAFLEKEKFRMEADKERRKRLELEEKVERLERELELCHLEEGEDVYMINMEQGRAIDRLQKQLSSAIQDIDQLRQQGEDVDYILRQLFHRIPDISPRDVEAPRNTEKSNRFTLDRFVVRVTDLVEENHQLLDRVLDLQTRQERFARS